MAILNRIAGVLRFSYPAKEGFELSRLPEDEVLATLYDEDRLARRFRLLETVTLPSLAAQTDGDFALAILAGDTLPAPHRTRLEELAARHPFLRVLFLPRRGALPSAKDAYRDALRHWGDAPCTHVTGFRIDDDDAVATDYVARTRDLAHRLLHAGLAGEPTAIGFTRGLYWDTNDPARPFHDVREDRALGLASAMITTPDLPTCIYRFNHRKLGCFVPTQLVPTDEPMFLCTLHGHNDSGRSIPPNARAVPFRRAARLLSDRFGLDPDAALALMPVPAEPDA
jgi:hypothetical protein